MRKTIIAVTVALSLVIASTASASIRPHTCYTSDGNVRASGYTSCAFANNISRAWNIGIERGTCSYQDDAVCHGTVYSPVTHRNYRVTCFIGRPVDCETSGNQSWITFYWYPS
jgi:hypothetical protein